MKVSVLNVGQADGTLIEMKDGTAVLVDSDLLQTSECI